MRYYDLLANADMARHGDQDGRGNLSEKMLRAWCTSYSEIATSSSVHVADAEPVQAEPDVSEWPHPQPCDCARPPPPAPPPPPPRTDPGWFSPPPPPPPAHSPPPQSGTAAPALKTSSPLPERLQSWTWLASMQRRQCVSGRGQGRTAPAAPGLTCRAMARAARATQFSESRPLSPASVPGPTTITSPLPAGGDARRTPCTPSSRPHGRAPRPATAGRNR